MSNHCDKCGDHYLECRCCFKFGLNVKIDGEIERKNIETIKLIIMSIKGVISVDEEILREKVKLEKVDKIIPYTTNMFTVTQMSNRHPAFSISSLRALIFCAKNNNFEKCIKRVGRKVLILEDEFLKWVAGNPTTKINYTTHDLNKYGR